MRAGKTGQYLTGQVALVIRGARGFGDDRQRFLDLGPITVFNRNHSDGGTLMPATRERAHRR